MQQKNQTQELQNNCKTVVLLTPVFLLKGSANVKGFLFNSKRILLYFSLYLSFMFSVNGQMTGWPTSSVSYILPNGGNTVFYADEARASVTGISGTTISFNNATAQFNSSTVNSTNPNNYLLIIQMEGTNAGTHERVTVSSASFSGSTGTITASAGLLTYNTSSKVQIIRVPIFDGFTLDPGGVVTCSPYNTSTGQGGILPLIANNLTINGGYFDVVGKGHVGITTLGTPGAGKTNNPYDGLSATNLNNNTPFCHSIPTYNTGTLGTNGNNGGTSDDAVNIGGTSSFSAPFTPYVAPSSGILLNMGKWGENPVGHKAGNGEGGGGHGGDGGNSDAICNNGNGGLGSPGADGQSGGEAGKASAGGGAMLIKIISTITNNTQGSSPADTRPRFYCDGGNGENGMPGNGGGFTGGVGGQGSPGCCDLGLLYYSGGQGGYGEPALGSGGGDGGAGGKCGTIWMKFFSAVPGDCVEELFSFKGGKGGAGGRGQVGLARNYQHTNAVAGDCVEWCEEGGGEPLQETCNCDCEIVMNAFKGSTYNNSNLWWDDGLGGNITWDGLKLIYNYSPSEKYCCPMWNPDNCDIIFDKLAQIIVLDPLSNSAFVVLPAVGNYWQTLIGSDIINVMEHVPAGRYIEDLSSPSKERCYEAGCYPTSLYGSYAGSKPGPDGADGSEEPVGTFGTGSGDNVNIEANAPTPFVSKVDELSIAPFKLSPNPATGFIQLSWSHPNKTFTYSITDINGKTIIENTTVESLNQTYQIKLPQMPSGNYFIQISTADGIQQRIQFIKQ